MYEHEPSGASCVCLMMAMENADLQRSAYSRRRLLATLGLPNSGGGVPSNRTCRQNADGIATPSREEMKKATGLVAEAGRTRKPDTSILVIQELVLSIIKSDTYYASSIKGKRSTDERTLHYGGPHRGLRFLKSSFLEPTHLAMTSPLQRSR